MGCCLSAGNRNREAENRRSIDGEPPTSPRAILEVETVKEVLLETTGEEKLKPKSPENQELKAELLHPPEIVGNRDAPGNEAGYTASEITEVSEIGSYSESLSAKAAMAADEDGVVDQRPPPRKRRGRGGGRGRRERVVARRVAPPPPEKRGPVRAVRGTPRNVAEGNGNGNVNGKNVEEDYGRSPVRQKEVAPPPPPRKESDEKTPAADGEAETLENPVVSLECFIFL
ncbi:hypothetical protein AAHA92_03129 [Salvia divinorum]|uniref:Uncharacterized protein n=1 Tax=Salvia divinorum TaxID=28513 RepID=A0ABD1IG50_SALDI